MTWQSYPCPERLYQSFSISLPHAGTSFKISLQLEIDYAAVSELEACSSKHQSIGSLGWSVAVGKVFEGLGGGLSLLFPHSLPGRLVYIYGLR